MRDTLVTIDTGLFILLCIFVLLASALFLHRGQGLFEGRWLAVHEQCGVRLLRPVTLDDVGRPVVAEENQKEKEEADENVEPEGRHLRRPLARVEVDGKFARLKEERDEVAKERRVEMEETFQRIEKDMPKGAKKLEIVLAALVAEGALQRGAAVLAMRMDLAVRSGGLVSEGDAGSLAMVAEQGT